MEIGVFEQGSCLFIFAIFARPSMDDKVTVYFNRRSNYEDVR